MIGVIVGSPVAEVKSAQSVRMLLYAFKLELVTDHSISSSSSCSSSTNDAKSKTTAPVSSNTVISSKVG